jgi:hypothetical protein
VERRILEDGGVMCTLLVLCTIVSELTFWDGVLHLIKINHQPNATIFQFIILTFVYISTCFGRFSAHHQELYDDARNLQTLNFTFKF